MDILLFLLIGICFLAMVVAGEHLSLKVVIPICFVLICGVVWLTLAHKFMIPHETIHVLHNHIEDNKIVYQYVKENDKLINITSQHGSIIYSDKVKKLNYHCVWSLGIYIVTNQTVEWEPALDNVEHE